MGCHCLLHKTVLVPTISAYTRGGEMDSSELRHFLPSIPLYCARPGQDAAESHEPCVTASCSSTKKVATLPSSSFQTEICILLSKELYVTSYYPLPLRVYFLSTCSSQVYHPKLKLFSKWENTAHLSFTKFIWQILHAQAMGKKYLRGNRDKRNFFISTYKNQTI